MNTANTTNPASIKTLLHTEGAVVWLRILSSLPWLDSAFDGKDAKLNALFLSGAGLVQTIREGFLNTAITPAVAHLLQSVVIPHAQLFAILIAVADLSIGISLSLGLFTRIGGLLAILRAATNILVAAGAGPDTIECNGLLIVAGAIALFTGAGRSYGLDAILRRHWPNSSILRILS